jgi:predicted nucleic acid-binding protein
VAERQVTFVDTNVLAYAALYAEWPVVQVDVPLILAASELEEHHTLSCWDARVVEAARRSGAGRLLTEDLQHGRVVGGVRIDNRSRDGATQRPTSGA